jgi:hypothetical protein
MMGKALFSASSALVFAFAVATAVAAPKVVEPTKHAPPKTAATATPPAPPANTAAAAANSAAAAASTAAAAAASAAQAAANAAGAGSAVAAAGSAAAAAASAAAAAGSAAAVAGSAAAAAGSAAPAAASALAAFDPSKLGSQEARLDALSKRIVERQKTLDARRQADRDRLHARWGGLVDQPAVRTELQTHATRVARLERIQELAQVELKPAVSRSASKALDAENARHEKAMTALAAGGGK